MIHLDQEARQSEENEAATQEPGQGKEDRPVLDSATFRPPGHLAMTQGKLRETACHPHQDFKEGTKWCPLRARPAPH